MISIGEYKCPFCVFESNDGDKFDKHINHEHDFKDYRPSRNNRLQCPACGLTGHFDPDQQGFKDLNSILCRNTDCDVELYVTNRNYKYFPNIQD